VSISSRLYNAVFRSDTSVGDNLLLNEYFIFYKLQKTKIGVSCSDIQEGFCYLGCYAVFTGK
jgi:hypothetical protein